MAKSVHVRPESVFTFLQNRCSRSPRKGVHVAAEYARTAQGHVPFFEWLGDEISPADLPSVTEISQTQRPTILFRLGNGSALNTEGSPILAFPTDGPPDYRWALRWVVTQVRQPKPLCGLRILRQKVLKFLDEVLVLLRNHNRPLCRLGILLVGARPLAHSRDWLISLA